MKSSKNNKTNDSLVMNVIDYYIETWNKKPKEFTYSEHLRKKLGIKTDKLVRNTKPQPILYIGNDDTNNFENEQINIPATTRLLYNKRKLYELPNFLLKLEDNYKKLLYFKEYILYDYNFIYMKAKLNELDFLAKFYDLTLSLFETCMKTQIDFLSDLKSSSVRLNSTNEKNDDNNNNNLSLSILNLAGINESNTSNNSSYSNNCQYINDLLIIIYVFLQNRSLIEQYPNSIALYLTSRLAQYSNSNNEIKKFLNIYETQCLSHNTLLALYNYQPLSNKQNTIAYSKHSINRLLYYLEEPLVFLLTNYDLNFINYKNNNQLGKVNLKHILINDHRSSLLCPRPHSSYEGSAQLSPISPNSNTGDSVFNSTIEMLNDPILASNLPIIEGGSQVVRSRTLSFNNITLESNRHSSVQTSGYETYLESSSNQNDELIDFKIRIAFTSKPQSKNVFINDLDGFIVLFHGYIIKIVNFKLNLLFEYECLNDIENVIILSTRHVLICMCNCLKLIDINTKKVKFEASFETNIETVYSNLNSYIVYITEYTKHVDPLLIVQLTNESLEIYKYLKDEMTFNLICIIPTYTGNTILSIDICESYYCENLYKTKYKKLNDLNRNTTFQFNLTPSSCNNYKHDNVLIKFTLLLSTFQLHIITIDTEGVSYTYKCDQIVLPVKIRSFMNTTTSVLDFSDKIILFDSGISDECVSISEQLFIYYIGEFDKAVT